MDHCNLSIFWLAHPHNFGGLHFEYFSSLAKADWCLSSILCKGKPWYGMFRIWTRFLTLWMFELAAVLVGNLNILGKDFTVLLIISATIFEMASKCHLKLSITNIMYQPMVNCGTHTTLFYGLSRINKLVQLTLMTSY